MTIRVNGYYDCVTVIDKTTTTTARGKIFVLATTEVEQSKLYFHPYDSQSLPCCNF